MIRYAPTEDDKKDCHRCRNGWPLIRNAGGYRAHVENKKELACLSNGPLMRAPAPPKRTREQWRALALKKAGYFLVGDVFIAAVAALVFGVYSALYYVLDKLPGGINAALHLVKLGAVDLVLGIMAIYAITVAGEFLWKTFKGPSNPTEPTT
jgi:hypothetical protein